MKRFIKYGVLPLITFLFLLTATVLVLPVVFNVEKFLPEIEKKLCDVTGRQVSIGPNMGLSFFPRLNISLSDLKIGNPQGYVSDEFIKIESFEARIKILPLLKGDVEISRLIIGGLEVNLEKKSDGGENWDFTRVNSEGKDHYFIIFEFSPKSCSKGSRHCSFCGYRWYGELGGQDPVFPSKVR